MKISVFGLGYVGSVTSVCLAELGHEVVGVDIHAPKVAAMREGKSPVMEPHLEEMLTRNLAEGRLTVTMDAAEAVARTTCSLVAVGTPSSPDGDVDLTAVERCVESIALTLREQPEKPVHTIIIRSTVPPGTTGRILALAARLSGRRSGEGLLGGMNPEFLREGVAVEDFFAPSLIVLGADDDASLEVMRAIYDGVEARVITVPSRASELLKYANNAFHGLKIAFANEIGRLADGYGVDGRMVMEVLCMDDKLNISTKYLRPGFAYGGSCLPKDLRALKHLAAQEGVAVPLLEAVQTSNDRHIEEAMHRILAYTPARVGMLGITFKAGTDDVRESPALRLAQLLAEQGVDVRMYDVNVDHKMLLGANRRYIEELVPAWQDMLMSSPDALLDGADVLVVTTDEPAHTDILDRWNGRIPVLKLSSGLPAREPVPPSC